VTYLHHPPGLWVNLHAYMYMAAAYLFEEILSWRVWRVTTERTSSHALLLSTLVHSTQVPRVEDYVYRLSTSLHPSVVARGTHASAAQKEYKDSGALP